MILIEPCQAKKVLWSMRKMCQITSSCACARSHPRLCSPFIPFVVKFCNPNFLLADSEGPDQTAQMRSLIRAFAARNMLEDTFSHGTAQLKFM